MSCIAISPIIALCLFVQLLALHQLIGALGGFWVGSEAINYAKKSLLEIHSNIAKRNLKSALFLASYPIIGSFLWVIAYPKQATIVNIAVISITLLVKNATCT